MATDKSQWSLADIVLPLLAILLAGYYLSTIQGIPFIAQMYGGGISILLLALSAVAVLIIVIRAVVTGRFKQGPGFRTEVRNWIARYKRAFALILGMALFIALISQLGYPIVSALFIGSAMYVLGFRDMKRVIATAVGVTILGYLLFIVFLNVRLPISPLG